MIHRTQDSSLTSGRLDVVYGVSVHLKHLTWLRLLLLVAANGEGVLGDLRQKDVDIVDIPR